MSSNLPFSCTQQLLTKAIWIKLVGDKKTFIVSFTTWTNQNAASCKECKIKLSLVEPEKHTRLFLQRLLNFHLKLTRSFSKEQCSLLNYMKLLSLQTANLIISYNFLFILPLKTISFYLSCHPALGKARSGFIHWTHFHARDE